MDDFSLNDPTAETGTAPVPNLDPEPSKPPPVVDKPKQIRFVHATMRESLVLYKHEFPITVPRKREKFDPEDAADFMIPEIMFDAWCEIFINGKVFDKTMFHQNILFWRKDENSPQETVYIFENLSIPPLSFRKDFVTPVPPRVAEHLVDKMPFAFELVTNVPENLIVQNEQLTPEQEWLESGNRKQPRALGV